jgi:hypothetical protein
MWKEQPDQVVGAKQLGEHNEQKRSETDQREQRLTKQSFLTLLDFATRPLHFTRDDTLWLANINISSILKK